MSQFTVPTDPLKIGTRDSKLALWQARQASRKLQSFGCQTELVPVKSEGDIDLKTPLSAFGGKGVFTKALDEALLDKRIDVAVHSFKDLPTIQTLPLKVVAVLERDDPRDVLVAPQGTGFLEKKEDAIVASGSNRRRSQWKARYPGHELVQIRGNVQTRIRKIEENGWDGGIFAAAGLKRIQLDEHISSYLDWMVPAPAQGAIAVMVREEDAEKWGHLWEAITHPPTFWATLAERELLNTMEAGCSAPVGAFARYDSEKNVISLRAVALSLDGKRKFEMEDSTGLEELTGFGERVAKALLKEGADSIIDEIKNA